VEVIDKLSQEAEVALVAGEARLRAGGLDGTAIARGLAAARITAALTDDAPLALGALLHEARPPGDEGAYGAGPHSLAVAAELARLGAARAAQWDDAGGLHGDQAEVLRKMLLAIVADPRLVVARIAVQLARLRAARHLPPDDRRRLAQEARAVFAPLANRLGVWQVKWELEDLAFRWLEPDGYRRIAHALAERRADRERYIAELCDTLRAALADAGIHGEVQGRAKHIYSIHRKMQRKRLEFDRLSDVRAVRIVCDTVPECYAALGVVHGRWTYLPGEFDDYIATPKDNYYRSIHTAVLGPLGKTVEVQIRTRDMHRQSELGVAAHWRYKEGAGRDDGYARKIEWVRRLLEPAEQGGGATRDGEGDFLERVRAELFEDRVYALTPKGEVVDMPRGATPLDFAYQVHTSLGHRCRGAKVDGRIVPLTHALANGQVVDIITGKHESPSRDWLVQDGYLASPRSRAKLRAWFRRADAGDNENAGRAIIERELSRLGIGLDLLPALASELKAGEVAQLHRWLGEGEVSVAAFVQAATRLTAQRARAAADPVPTRRRAGAASVARRRAGGPVLIEGVGDLPITLARCCGPIPPGPIAGYVTIGRGVTVHAERCRSLARMRDTHPDRVLRVDWRDDGADGLPVGIRIEAWDRRGLVRDLSDIVAAAGLGIEQLTTTTDRGAGTATLELRTAVRDLAELSTVLRALGRVPNVISVRRSG
jgi:GTP pyrophosphokinase